MSTDRILPRLREIEDNIDKAYQSNPLIQLARPQALWYLLSAYEEYFIKSDLDQNTQSLTIYEQSALTDNLINQLKWPMRWIYSDCNISTNYSTKYSDHYYSASMQLLAHSFEYMQFESAFSYASWGIIDLRLDNNTIKATPQIEDEAQYDAYDRFTHEQYNPKNGYDFEKIINLIQNDVTVIDTKFSYKLKNRTVAKVTKLFRKTIDNRFRLPTDWKLTKYPLDYYSSVLKTLWIISAIHYCARIVAANRGCVGLGYSQSLIINNRSQLIRKLVGLTELPSFAIDSILTDLTYGKRDMRFPDPALQPLFEIVPGQICWSPNLILTAALERNLLVLLNRTSSGRKSYSQISGHKETILRDSIISDLQNFNFRFKYGKVPSWGTKNDIDIAIISDEQKCCLLVELKSFFGPADPKELYHKSKDIAKGIDQIFVRQKLALEKPNELYSFLKINDDYVLYWAVVSETSIGGGWVQNEMVPVIRNSHLVSKIAEHGNLLSTCSWLMNREYLPTDKDRYQQIMIKAKILDYSLNWYGIALF